MIGRRCGYCAKPGHFSIDCPIRNGSTMCNRCWGLPHRREDNGACAQCGELYAPEVIERETRNESMIAGFQSW